MSISRHVLAIAFVIGTIAVVGSYALSYFRVGHSGLPIGWDTPHYIGQINTILSEGYLPFVQKNEFYNFAYAGIASLLVSAGGISPVTTEVFFPIFLSVSLMGASGYLAKKYLQNTEIAVYTILLAATWFGLYRIGTDLHPNLLALVLLIAGLSCFPPWYFGNKLGRLSRYVFFALILLVSFVHIESTLFFSFVILIASIIYERKLSSECLLIRVLKHIFPISFAVLPSVILFYFHLANLLNYTRGNPVFQPPLPAYLWLSYLGFLLPFSLYGLYLAFKATQVSDSGESGPLSFPYRAFLATWAVTSIVVASVDYVIPALSIFSERALMLFPTPFLAAIGLKSLLDRARKGRLFHFSKRARSIVIVSILATVFAAGWVITYVSNAPNQQVYVSLSAYQKLVWLSNNPLLGKSIFVFSEYDEIAGGMGNLWNNWVQAIYGDHYSYLGRLDFLLAKQETPFKSATSRQISLMFLDRMVKDGVFSGNEILNHDVVIIEDFYRTGDFEKEYQGILNQISEGIFVVNMQEAEERYNFIPLYSSVYEKVGDWYRIETNWTLSTQALEFVDPNPSGPKYVEIPIPSASQGDFSLSLRYWDGLGSDVLVELNGTSLGRIRYEQTGEPRIFATSVSKSQGIYFLKITLEYTPGIPQYASLDFVEISKENI